MSDKTFVAPKMIDGALINDLANSLEELRRVRRPAPLTVLEAEMDARLADYVELCEQAFIEGWTDCEEKITSKEYKTDAYYVGYHQCMKALGGNHG